MTSILELPTAFKHSHTPLYDTYIKRKNLLESRLGKPTQVLTGDLPRGASLGIWSGDSIDLESLTFDLTANEIEEVETGLRTFKAKNIHLDELSSDTFQIPILRSRLRSVANEVFQGRGIAIIRGLKADKYSLEDNIIIHAGISSHVAPLRGNQSGLNDKVFHICSREHLPIDDLKSNSTAVQIPFHTDDTDVLAFYAVETSISGGDMMWASQGQVYNDLAANRPEVLPILAADQWPLQMAAEPPQYIRLPLLYADKKGPFFWLPRGNFTGTARTPRAHSIPNLDLAQADALDAVHFAACKHAVSVAPQKGDMYFVNNFSVFHARTSFVDECKAGEQLKDAKARHLLRLWLRDPAHGRNMAGPLKRRWEQVFDTTPEQEGRWLTFRDMEPDAVSEALFKGNFPIDTFSSCQNN